MTVWQTDRIPPGGLGLPNAPRGNSILATLSSVLENSLQRATFGIYENYIYVLFSLPFDPPFPYVRQALGPPQMPALLELDVRNSSACSLASGHTTRNQPETVEFP